MLKPGSGHYAVWAGVVRATGGIIGSMRRFHAYFLVVSLSALLVLSSVGPLFDHHYVERDPTHTHLGAARPHVHDYTSPDAHDHARPQTPDAPRGVVALLDRDAGFVGITNVVTDRDGATAFVYFEPSSLFNMPIPPTARLRSEETPPPDKPPRMMS